MIDFSTMSEVMKQLHDYLTVRGPWRGISEAVCIATAKKKSDKWVVTP